MPTVHARFENADVVAGRYATVRARLRHVQEQAPSEGADAAVPAYQAVAPKRSGRLAGDIHAEQGDVLSTAQSDRGYSYTGVTRFGHRHAEPDRIFPHPPRRALRFSVGGRTLVRRSVARYHPLEDWATRGHPEAARLAGERFQTMVHDAIGD